jgi:hypothetical protein
VARVDELAARRDHECRLTSDRALESLDDAAAWVAERGLVAAPESGSLPSLHVACHEEPYKPDSRGYGLYPKTKWWWRGELARRPEILWLKIHRGKGLLVHERVAALVDPLARVALSAAEAGEHGEEARRLVRHLAAAGPSLADDVKVELDQGTKALRGVRVRLERWAAVVARRVPLDEDEERFGTELARWDQLGVSERDGDVGDLLVAGVRAAVLAPEREAVRWFSWSVDAGVVDRLVRDGVLARVDGYLSLASDS